MDTDQGQQNMSQNGSEGESRTLLSQGAEAVTFQSLIKLQRVYLDNYLGEKVVVKERFIKKYRHPELDTRLTKKRIKAEVKNIEKARKALVNVPGIRKVDHEKRTISFEYLEGHQMVKDFVNGLDQNKLEDIELGEHYFYL